jgi:hypothetical protein
MGISNVNLTMKMKATATATNTNAVGNVKGIANPFTTLNYVTGTTAALGINEVYAGVVQVAPGASTTIDLLSFTDLVNQLGVALARVKNFYVELLTTADGGSAASSVTIGGGSQPQPFFLSSAASTWTLNNGSFLAWGDNSPNGVAVNSSQFNVRFVNNDGSNVAYLQVLISGSDA